MENRKFTKSVVSGTDLISLFSLGDLYVSDFLKPDENPKYPPCKLELAFDAVSKVVQLTEQPCQESMFGSFYWYLSGTNPQMKESLGDLSTQTIKSIPFKEKSIYLDIASNDGTLLSCVPNNLIKMGIDPSRYEHVKNSGLNIQEYFSKSIFRRYSIDSARYISCAAMFYDLSNPLDFLKDVYEVLEDDGIFTLQLSYTPINIMQCEIGVICHEHLCYYSLLSLKYLMDKVGFVIKDLELNNVNGGSIRLYLQKESANNFRSPVDRDVCRVRVESLLEWEMKNGYDTTAPYLDFYQKMLDLKEKTVNFIKAVKSEGKSVYLYGASTKISTLIQFMGLDKTLIDKASEKQGRKVGLTTINGIPIISDEQMRLEQPDYLLVGPWFFLENFKRREKDYLDRGGAFILTSPEFSIYKNEKT